MCFGQNDELCEDTRLVRGCTQAAMCISAGLGAHAASDGVSYSNLLSARSEAPCGRSRGTRSGLELTLQQV